MWVFQISLNTLCWKQFVDLYMSILVYNIKPSSLIQSSTTSKAYQGTPGHPNCRYRPSKTQRLVWAFWDRKVYNRKNPMHREHTSILCEPIHGKHVRSTDRQHFTLRLLLTWMIVGPINASHACLHAHVSLLILCDFPPRVIQKGHQSPATLHESLSLVEGLNF